LDFFADGSRIHFIKPKVDISNILTKLKKPGRDNGRAFSILSYPKKSTVR